MRNNIATLLMAVSLGASTAAHAGVTLFLNMPQPPTVAPGASVRSVFLPSATSPVDATLDLAFPDSFAIGNAEGEGWKCTITGTNIGCRGVISGNSAPVNIDYVVPSSLDGGRFVVPIRLAPVPPNGGNTVNTSVTINVARTFEVRTPDDFGAGSLREAITQANARCDGSVDCRITFTPMAIHPSTPLPAITACSLLVDAGVSEDILAPRAVEINGAGSSYGNGLEIRSPCGVTVQGLAINGFAANGVVIAPPLYESRSVYVRSCSIGTTSDASAARPNGLRGISVETPFAFAFIQSSVISGNMRSGIAVWDANRVYVSHSIIGLGRDYRAIPNGASGIFVARGSAAFESGLIALNREFGIAIAPGAHAAVLGSVLCNGGQDVDYGLDGPSPPTEGVPPAPVILDGAYDAVHHTTILHVSVSKIGRNLGYIPRQDYRVAFYSTVPDAHLDTFIDQYILNENQELVTVTLFGDRRGETIRAATQHNYESYLDTETFDTSEYSAPFTIPK